MTATTIKDGAPADAVSNNVVKVTVKDINDNPLVGYDIDFVGDDSSHFSNKKVTTDQAGSVTNMVHSSVAGPHMFTAALALNPKVTAPINATYSGDIKSAHVVSASETGASIVANGKDINKVRIIVQDNNGNNVNNAIVSLYTKDPNISFTHDTVTTKSDGSAFIEVMSTKSSQHTFSAVVNGASKNSYDINVSFIGDPNTATVKNINILKNNSIADGKDTNIFSADFSDAYGNPVSNVTVTISLPSGINTLTPEGQKTDENGTVSFSIVSNKKPGTYKFTLSYTTPTGSKTISTPDFKFKYDSSSLEIKHNVIKDNASTNNVETDTIEIKVFDKNNIPAVGATLNVTVDSDGLTYPQTIDIPPSGMVLLSVSSHRAGYKTITTSINDIKASSRIYFVADSKTGTLNALKVIKDNARVFRANKIQAVVSDSHGDPVEGALVKFQTPSEISAILGEYVTDKDGKTQEIEVYSRGIHGPYTIGANVVNRPDSEAKTSVVNFDIAGTLSGNGSSVKFTKQGNDILTDFLVMRGDDSTPVEDNLFYAVKTQIWDSIKDTTSSTPEVYLKQGKAQILHRGVCDGTHSGENMIFYATLVDKNHNWLNESSHVKIDDICK